MKTTKSALGGGLLVLIAAFAAAGGIQDQAPLGFVSKDRVVEMAAAADPSVTAFAPSPDALASFAALVDPVHVRMFLRASQAADLRLAAAVGKAAEAAANPAFSVEFVAVSDDLSEPKALIGENAVTAAPEIIVYWLGAEVGRMRPAEGASMDKDLADFIFTARTQVAEEMLLDREFFKYAYHKDLLSLDCKRCHGPAGSGLLRPSDGPRSDSERPF